MMTIKSDIDRADHSTVDGNKINDRIRYAWKALLLKHQTNPHSIIFVKKPEISTTNHDIEKQFKSHASHRNGWNFHIHNLHIDNREERNKVTKLLRNCPAAKIIVC